MMELTNQTKELLRYALLSHKECAHKDSTICFMLMLAEVSMVRGDPIAEDEEVNECGAFLADAVLEGLILKGYVEVEGVTEDGDFLLQLTANGEEVYEERINRDHGEDK